MHFDSPYSLLLLTVIPMALWAGCAGEGGSSQRLAEEPSLFTDVAPEVGITHRTFVALGQAYAKAGRYDETRRAWRGGIETFPDAEELGEHLAIREDRELLACVQERHSLEQAIDTDISFYSGKL